MRFAIDASPLGRPQPSGVRTILRALLPEILKLLDEDRLVLWQNDPEARRRPLAAPEHPSLVRRTCRLSPRVLEALWRRIDWPKVEWFTGAVDVFHSIQGRLPATRLARSILTLHDFRHRRLPQFYSRDFRWFPPEIARADHFIAVSDSTRTDAMRFLDIPEERITRIYSGPPEPGPVLDGEQAARERARFALRGPYIFCPSANDPRKNVAGAIEGFLGLKRTLDVPHQLAVVGALPAAEETDLYALARAAGGDGVVFTGTVSDREYAALLSGAAAIVQPSLNEGFGFPVLEAFQAGIPQAVADNSAFPETAGGAALTFNPWEPDEIAAAMERLITERALAEGLVARGRRRLLDFSWERSARETLALYRTLARRERSPVFIRPPSTIR